MPTKMDTKQMETIKVGEGFRDFSLKDQNGKDFKLSEQAWKRVLLSFHPLAWTSICAEQMKSLEANKKTFDSLNTVAVGLSVDSVPTKKAWAKSLGIVDTKILADFWPHGGVASLYGLFREVEGFAQRANVLVNEDGKVVFVKVYELKQLPPIDEIIEAIKKLG
ncbi:MAG TPA: redoxin domain-containing protein [Methanothrix sp.]